eukprot:705700-Rhodomonas_salina.1
MSSINPRTPVSRKPRRFSRKGSEFMVWTYTLVTERFSMVLRAMCGTDNASGGVRCTVLRKSMVVCDARR